MQRSVRTNKKKGKNNLSINLSKLTSEHFIYAWVCDDFQLCMCVGGFLGATSLFFTTMEQNVSETWHQTIWASLPKDLSLNLKTHKHSTWIQKLLLPSNGRTISLSGLVLSHVRALLNVFLRGFESWKNTSHVHWKKKILSNHKNADLTFYIPKDVHQRDGAAPEVEKGQFFRGAKTTQMLERIFTRAGRYGPILLPWCFWSLPELPHRQMTLLSTNFAEYNWDPLNTKQPYVRTDDLCCCCSQVSCHGDDSWITMRGVSDKDTSSCCYRCENGSNIWLTPDIRAQMNKNKLSCQFNFLVVLLVGVVSILNLLYSIVLQIVPNKTIWFDFTKISALHSQHLAGLQKSKCCTHGESII